MDMNQFLAELSIALVPVIATGLAGLITVGIAYLSGMVKQKFGEAAQDKADMYLGLMQDAAMGAVVAVQQTTVDALKKANKWDAESAKEVKEKAVSIALASLGKLQDEIAKQLLIDVPAHMGLLVELALKGLKESQKAG